MDVSTGFDTGMNYPKGIYIPQDDQLYLSSYRNGPKPAELSFAEVSLYYTIMKLLLVIKFLFNITYIIKYFLDCIAV
jgi:hypothetical protein